MLHFACRLLTFPSPVKALSRSTVILFCGVQFHMVKVAKKVYQEMKMAWQ